MYSTMEATYQLLKQFRDEQIQLKEKYHHQIQELLQEGLEKANAYALEHSLSQSLSTFVKLFSHYTSVTDETLKDVLWDVVQKKYTELNTHQEKLFACMNVDHPDATCAETVANWLTQIDEFFPIDQTNLLHCTLTNLISVHEKYNALVEDNTLSMQQVTEDYETLGLGTLTEAEISHQNEVTQSRIESNHAQYEQERKDAENRIPNLQLRAEPKINSTPSSTGGIGKWL